MARIICIDYGMKKCGLATTDPLQIIVTGLDTIRTQDLLGFVQNYLKDNEVEKIVFGDPKHTDGTPTYLRSHIDKFVLKLRNEFSSLEIDFMDESYSSFEAKQIILQSGVRKKKRQDKTLVDKISAVLILQKYLGHI